MIRFVDSHDVPASALQQRQLGRCVTGDSVPSFLEDTQMVGGNSMRIEFGKSFQEKLRSYSFSSKIYCVPMHSFSVIEENANMG
jgi:hypothetical protein